jgi:hypothetical protein
MSNGISYIPFRHDGSEAVSAYSFSIRCFREALIALEPVRIDLGTVGFLRPFGLNLLAGMIYELLRHGQNVSITPPSDQKVYQYLSDQGFYSEFPTGPSGHILSSPRSTSVGLRRLDQFDPQYLESVAHWLRRNSSIPLGKVEDIVMVTMPEIINNVFDHSKSPFGCYVCAQAYPQEGRLMLSVIDFGIGFYGSLLQRYHSRINNDAEAIDLAVQDGISSKARKNNAGRGLHILSDWVRERNGQLEIVSHDGYWKQDSQGRTGKRILPFEFPGSCINLCVHTDDLPLVDPEEWRRYG